MTAQAIASDALAAPESPARRFGRAPLAVKLAIAFLGLVAFVLIVNGAIDTWLTYNQAKRAALEVEQEKARGAAERVGAFLNEIQTELGWTAGVEWGYAKLEQQRYDFIRLLRQAPAITALSYIDGHGREQIAVSRLEPDSIGGGKDFSADPRFVRAVADKIWFGPVEFRRGSEPYMTIALAHVGKTPGVTVADVNLKLVWDVVSAIHVGEKGFAYVVDDRGRLIAHPDLSLVLRDSDLSHLPQVAAALAGQRSDEASASPVGSAEAATSLDGAAVLTAYAIAPKTHWVVFVEQPLAEALATAYHSLARSLALLGLGLALAAVSGVALARRMAAPIRLLQQGAEKLGAGDLSQRLDIKTGDEIEALAGAFNQMAGRLQESHETLEAKVEARTKDLNETLEQQTATADVLKVISRSAFDLQVVLDTLIGSAVKLCGAEHGLVYLRRGDAFYVRAFTNPDAEPAFIERLRSTPQAPGRGSVGARVLLTGEVQQVPDVQSDREYDAALRSLSGHRALLGVPLKRDGAVVGAIALARLKPGPYSPRQIELVQTFADQAVIAIENARLFEEVQARTRDLEESLERQTATSKILEVIASSPSDAQPVFDAIASSAKRLLGGLTASVYSYVGEMVRLVALTPTHPAADRALQALFPQPIAEYRPAQAVSNGRPFQIEDTETAPNFPVEMSRTRGFRALVHMPLMSDGAPIGLIGVTRVAPGPFPAHQIELLRTFADQAVIAIKNARLFEEVQARTRDLEESLAQQTATADVLKVISRSAFDLQVVLDTLIGSAVKLCGAENGLIYLRRDDAFYVRAFTNPDAEPAFIERLRNTPQVAGRGSVGARVLLTGEVQQVPDTEADREYDVALRSVSVNRGLLGVPLKRDGAVVGAIALARQKPGSYSPRQIELAQTFADQAVIAIENARLFDEVQARTHDLEESLAQQTATADVLRVISRSAFDLDTILKTLVRSAMNLCRADAGQIFRRHDDGTYRYAASSMDVPSGYEEHERNAVISPGRGTLIGRVALDKTRVQIVDAWADAEYAEQNEARLGGVRGMLGVPLLRDGEPIGAFALARFEPTPFTRQQVDLVTTFADQAVIAIENARLFEEVQARTKDLEESLTQQTATADVLKVISRSAFDLDTVLNALLISAAHLVGAQGGVISLREGAVFRSRTFLNVPPEIAAYMRENPFSAGRSRIGGRVVESGKVSIIPNVQLDADLEPSIRNQMPSSSMVGVPLLRNEAVEGVFNLTRMEPGNFTPRQIELIQTFADQAVIAIENARLFEEVQAKTRDLEESLTQQTATADVLKVISRSAFDLDAIFQTLVASAVDLCKASSGTVCVRDGDVFRYRGMAGPEASADLQRFLADHPLVSPTRNTMAGRAILSGQAEEISDVLLEEEYAVPFASLASPARALLGVPLVGKREVQGAIVVSRAEPGGFPPRHVEILKTFADQAVIAIENARLFEEVQAKTRDLEESLAQQTATADVLKVIGRSAFDLETVLNTLVSSAQSLCSADFGTICLREGDYFHAHATAGVDPGFLAALKAKPQHIDDRSLTPRVGRTGRIEHIPDQLLDPDYQPPEGTETVARPRSLLGVPLLREGVVEGTFVLMRMAHRPFAQKDIELAQTFADQAMIAIGNVRLFDEVQARTRELEESLTQQTATADVLKVISRSAFDLQSVSNTLLASAAQLCEADRGAIYLRDGDLFRCHATFNHSAEAVAFFKANPRRLGDGSIVPRVVQSGALVVIEDVLADPDFSFPGFAKVSPSRALLGVPLLRQDRVEGVFSLARDQPSTFSRRQLELVQTFADQALIAVENTRLFDEVQARTRELETSLSDLRKTQDRLVQSEKLASLGQLTAGIAHEIKNPLNFVNNFASLSRELLDEMKETLAPAPLETDARAEVDELMGMLDSNLEKVAHHGKRADSIVKNMLLHSREGSGERARVDVNAMVEEALNLGYHGARAEKPGFNVTIEKHLAPDAGDADLYLQEMTRVLLNLVSNGFYATAKRKREEGADYQPTLIASTRSLGDRVEIRVRDNGGGIPAEVRAKMFNPFFTTKPAGEGTGLGLSLSHDIVVKQHGGTIDVETEPRGFTEFIITLPRGGAKA